LDTKANKFGLWLKIVLSVSFIVALLLYIDIGKLWAQVLTADPVWIAAAIGLALFLQVGAAYKWWLLMTRGQVALLSIIKVVFFSNFVGVFTPGTVGIELARVAGASYVSNEFVNSVASVLTDRVFGLLTLALTLVIGYVTIANNLPIELFWMSLGSLVCFAGLALFLLHGGVRRQLFGKIPQTLRAKLDKFEQCLAVYASRKADLVASFALSFGYQLGRIVMVYWLALAIDIDVPFLIMFLIVPATLLVQMLPFSISGLGVREAVLVVLLGTVGVSAEAAFLLGILIFLLTMAISVPGSIVFMLPEFRKDVREA